MTAKNSKRPKRQGSASDKRYEKGAKRPLRKSNAATRKAAKAMVENANYEEIVSAANFFYDAENNF